MRNHSPMVSAFSAFLLAVMWLQMRVACSSSSSPLAPALYAFGDSLVDSGNNNLLPTLDKADYLPYGNKFTGVSPDDSPMGGPSPTSSGKCLNLGDQVRLFESAAHDDLPRLFKSSNEFSGYLDKSIFAFLIGSNDYIINYLNPTLYSTSKTYEPRPFAKLLVAALSRHLERLYNMGARKFVVFQIGPIGCIPTIAKKSNHDGVCGGGPNLLVSYFNQMLQPMLQNVTFSLSGSMFVLDQANSLGYDAIINPSKYGLTDSRNPCYTTWRNGTLSCVPLRTPCPIADKHFFWDGYHPTDAASSIIASRCFNDTKVCSPVSIQDLVRI
ncbi:hypothetical protein NL676_014750 [Syzygium grande]|nr:hypothetical protein NL676_014750 [Syzygium grande]